ncbi:MAG: hypothetical protein OEW05_05985 [Candidatus Aminicenantes bacterium]|nr:hypothetical protein [Candidatus Aminicenantes bacterium]
MPRTSRRAVSAGILVLTTLSSLAFGQADLTLKDVLKRNILASGGAEKLAQVTGLSFRTGGTRTVVSAAGELKAVSGRGPVMTEAILVRDGKVRRNSFGTVTEVTGPQQVIHETLAGLYAGVFSLLKFEGRLELAGLKTYGPEKLYDLTMTSGGLKVDFFVRAEDFFLKRLLFQGRTPEGDAYEVNTDFAPFEDEQGYLMPLSWFSSQVGTRGNLAEVTEVEFNPPLDKDFFKSIEVNIGKTEAAPGELKGNVLDFNASRFGLMITTNWTKKDFERAAFRPLDKLVFHVEGLEAELDYYSESAEIPGPDVLSKGARFLGPAPRGGATYVIQFIAVDTAPLVAKLKPLAPISVKKK